ncbi:hypothetical protein [Pontimicrobium sp. SW4]|uniref:Uncharacterized protein n=1 Tax=Pontimicrobium sp. SW4 TaxID=3153519 RepID=A0AAU7BQH9_9FLAO
MRLLKIIGHILFVVLLTILTQVGGLIWLITIITSSKIKKKKRLVFPLLYLTFNILIIPPIAKLFGRERLPVFSENVKPRNWVYPLLFRNYVNPNLKNLLFEDSSKNEINITYLDANFPFINGFPLLPHLSHNDGKKIDISFMYLDKEGKPTNKKPSVSGYGFFSNSEDNYSNSTCLEKGYWQYDYPKYLTFGTINELALDEKVTKKLIQNLIASPITQKIFIEPHLKQSLGLSNESKIRFHGCGAVRHDDHIHLQIK